MVTTRNWIRNASQITRVIGDFDGWKLESEIVPDLAFRAPGAVAA